MLIFIKLSVICKFLLFKLKRFSSSSEVIPPIVKFQGQTVHNLLNIKYHWKFLKLLVLRLRILYEIKTNGNLNFEDEFFDVNQTFKRVKFLYCQISGLRNVSFNQY